MCVKLNNSVNSPDNKKINKLWEQTQREKNVYNMEGAYYIISVDQTGSIGVAAKYYATERYDDFKWLSPIEVFGVEEPAGSKHKYSAKTEQMLELFKPGTIHRKVLEAHAKLTAISWERTDDDVNQETENEFYYNAHGHHFTSTSKEYEGAVLFKAIMELRSTK